MTSITRRRARRATLIAALVLAAGCGSSDDATDAAVTPATAAVTIEGGADPEAVEAEVEAAPADTTAAAEPAETAAASSLEPDAAPAGFGEISIVLNDGRTWALDADLCTFDADAAGPGAAIVNIGGSNDEGVELGVLEAWPLDGSTDTGTAFIANFVDENDELFILVNGSPTMAGSTIQVTADATLR